VYFFCLFSLFFLFDSALVANKAIYYDPGACTEQKRIGKWVKEAEEKPIRGTQSTNGG